MIRAVTFDLWNTLLVERNYASERIRVLGAELLKHGAQRDEASLSEAFREGTRRFEDAWINEHTQLSNRDRFEIIFSHLGVQLPEGEKARIVEEVQRVFLADPPGLKLGVRETLRALHPRLRMGIISDTGVSPGSLIRRHLEREGVLGYFGSLVFSDETGVAKPEAAAFRRALGELRVEPGEAVHVGDLLRTDVAGAQRLGMKSVWVFRGDQTEDVKPDYTIRELPELLDLPQIREALET